MKNVLATLLLTAVAPSTFAASTMCGLNIEKIKGSAIYDQNVYFEKAPQTSFHIFVLADGSVVREDQLTTEFWMRIQAGDRVFAINMENEGVQLTAATVYKDSQGRADFKTVSAATTTSGNLALVANGGALVCETK